MKTPLCPLAFAIVAVGALVSGCVQTSDRGLVSGAPAYSDPTRVELITTTPERPHVVIGEIRLAEGDWRNEQVAETKIRTEAARMNADAVIVYGRSGPQNPKAIRYTDTTPARGTTVVSAGGAAGALSGATGGTGGSGGGYMGGGSGGHFPDAGH